MMHRATSLLFFLAIVAAAMLGHALHQRNWLHAADDQMYLTGLALRHNAPERYDALHEEARILVAERAESPWILTRLDARYRYRDNYFGYSWAGSRTFEASGGDFAARIARSLTLPPMLMTGVATLLLVAALMMARDRALTVSVAALSVIVVYEQFIAVDYGDRVLPDAGQWVNPLFVLDRVGRLLIDPGESTTLFGAAPRCAFSLLLLAAFVLRWQGRAALGYWLFLPMTSLHQSQAGLFLAIVVGLDLLLRPNELRRPAILAAILVAGGLFVVRERIWFVVGWESLIALPIGTAVYLLIRTPDVGARLASMRALPAPVADAVLLATGWLAFLLFTAVVNYFVSPAQSSFFWNHIAGRLLGTLRPEMVVGVIYWAWSRLNDKRKEKRYALGLAVALWVLLLPVALFNWPPTVFNRVGMRVATEVGALERQVRPMPKVTGNDEAVVYYALARSLAEGDDWLQRLR